MLGSIFSIIVSILKAIFGGSANQPSAEAIASSNAATANADLSVSKTSEAATDRVAQAEVSAPTTKADVVNSLNSGEF